MSPEICLPAVPHETVVEARHFRRGVVEAVIFFFVGKQIVIEIQHALSSHPQVRNTHNFIGVEVSNELVSIRLHFFDVRIEVWLCETDSLQQAAEKCGLICDDFSPVVLPALVTKKLAPLQDADVKKVAIRSCPELTLKCGLPLPPSGLEESEIADEVATENADPPKHLPTCHGQFSTQTAPAAKK